MTVSANAPAAPRWRAPAEHGRALVDPPFSRFAECLSSNADRLGAFARAEGGAWCRLRRDARRDLLAAAVSYSRTYRDAGAADLDRPILMTGHQPELFHPGVWFKNFALAHHARRLGASAVHLIIDNDVPHGVSVRFPVRSDGRLHAGSIAFDARGEAEPFEERRVRDRGLFASFADRVRNAVSAWIPDPLVERLWPDVIEAAERTGRLGLALAQGRHRLEARWGLDTLEVPLSRVCDGDPFRRFASYLLSRSERFARDYNAALAEFRREHRIRSRTHPVAELAVDGEWREAPFWIWTAERPSRRRLFVRRRAARLELTDRARVSFAIPESRFGLESLESLDAWRAAGARGVRVRPRALVTTLFARFFLGDLFLHGIGGAKYDRLTDAIASRFFGREPPAFATLSATVLPPVEHPNVPPDAVGRVDSRLRELAFHPERHAPRSERAEQLAAEKRDWTTRPIPDTMRGARHAAVTRINADFQPLVEPLRHAWRIERAELIENRRVTELWASREFAFCLFPEERLCSLLLDLCREHP